MIKLEDIVNEVSAFIVELNETANPSLRSDKLSELNIVDISGEIMPTVEPKPEGEFLVVNVPFSIVLSFGKVMVEL